MDSQPQALLDRQESEMDEAAESESDIEIGTTDSSSAKPQPEETHSV
jgi:hypothetical protein